MFSNASNLASPLLIIGDYLFDPRVGQLTGPSGAHHLNSRMTALLVYLVDHCELLVHRDELIHELWPEKQDAVRALHGHIARLRRYFEDCAKAPRYIVTIPNHGYRLVAPVFGSAPKPVSLADSSTWNKGREQQANSSGNGFTRFVREFRDRKVCRSMVIYTLVIWLIFQVTDVVVPALGLPEWVQALVVMLGILGFPIAATLSWIFDLTPTGPMLNRARVSAAESGASRTRGDLVLDLVLVSAAIVISSMLMLNTLDLDELSLVNRASAEPESIELMEDGLMADRPPFDKDAAISYRDEPKPPY